MKERKREGEKEPRDARNKSKRDPSLRDPARQSAARRKKPGHFARDDVFGVKGGGRQDAVVEILRLSWSDSLRMTRWHGAAGERRVESKSNPRASKMPMVPGVERKR